MRIDAIAIDGFGVWHDWRLVPGPGLTVVCGDNEAGKTTLLAFVRAILFGFETNQYPAVGGGRRGGWLEVTTADERHFRIARYHDRGGQGSLQVVGDDGVDRGAEYLPRLLHGVEASVYRNVFAFRLDELSEPKGLTEGGVAARIYGAGFGTGAASALAVENALRGEVAGLFRPGGSNPRINQLLKQIEDVERELSVLDLPAEYAVARARLAELEAEQERLAAEIESTGMERRRVERIDAAWSPVQELRAAEDALRDEPEPPPGITGALERFSRLEAAVRASEERLEEVARRVERARAQLGDLHPDARLLGERTRVEQQLEARASLRAEAGALLEAEQQLASAARQLEETLVQLGEGWSEQRLAALDLSVATRAALGGRFRDVLDGSTRDLERGRGEASTADAAVAALSGELDALDRRGAAAGAGPEEEHAVSAPFALAAAPLAGGLIVAAILLATGAPLAGLASAVIGAAGAAIVWLRRPASASGDTEAARRAAMDERRAMIAEQLERAERTREGAAARLEASARRASEARAEWREWAAARGYDPELDRETALSLLDAATAARSAMRRRDEASEIVARLAAHRTAYLAEALEVLSALGRPSSETTLEVSVDALAAQLAGSISAEHARARLHAELEELEPDAAAARERRERDVTALAGLLAEHGLASEAELREAVERAEHRRTLEEAAARARQALATIVGHGDGVDRLAADVAEVADIAEVRDRLPVVRQQLGTLAAIRDGVLQEIGGLQGRIDMLEASAEGSSARQRHADLVSRLEAEAEEWSVRRLAVALMERTRQRYEREHRPRVISAAEEYLAEWTDGRWVRILAPLGGAIEGLEAADGRQAPIAALSRGTQEQLYLALRFGLIEHFADEAEPLPIVMDETLVNFDDARAERTARTIEKLSARHQILYFTCRTTTPLRSPAVVRLQPPALAGAVGADRPPAVERVTA